jgi:hypothetical protein
VQLEAGAADDPTALVAHEEPVEVLRDALAGELRFTQQREHVGQILRLGAADHVRAPPSRRSSHVTLLLNCSK